MLFLLLLHPSVITVRFWQGISGLTSGTLPAAAAAGTAGAGSAAAAATTSEAADATAGGCVACGEEFLWPLGGPNGLLLVGSSNCGKMTEVPISLLS